MIDQLKMQSDFEYNRTGKYSDFAASGAGVDLRKRRAMVDFLRWHDRHDDDGDFHFSHNVKLHSLNIPYALQDQAWQVVAYWAETGDPLLEFDLLFEDFKRQHGREVGFVGRSGGHIALFDSRADLSPDDLQALDLAELRELVRLVAAFDALCDDAVAAFMEYVTEYEVVTEQVQVTKTVQVLQPKAEIDDQSE